MHKAFDILMIIIGCCLLVNCNPTKVDNPDDFPMNRFSSYLPYHVGDTVFYDRYYQQGRNDVLRLDHDIPFVVTDVVNYYDEGDIYSFTNEYAEYGVTFLSHTDDIDTISLSVHLVCTGRTRIKVQYIADALYNHNYYTSITGEYKIAYSSDWLFTAFPSDSITLENEAVRASKKQAAGILKNRVGLAYFYDMMMYMWKLSEHNNE